MNAAQHTLQKPRKLGLAICCFFSALALLSTSAHADKFTVGVVPQYSSSVIQDTWQPILEEIEARTGHHFDLVLEPDITQFEVAFERGDYDFAYMNPWHAVIAYEKQKYMPILKDNAKTLKGILTVRSDSPIKDVKELDGAEIAFPSPNALSASLLMRTELATLHGLDIKPVYVRTHPSVYLNVALGASVAGGGVLRTLRAQPQELQDQLRILYETREVAPHPIVMHPRVANSIGEQVAEALLDMGSDDKGKSLLSGIPIEEIGEATIDDYLPLEEWRLREFYVSN